MRRLKDFEDVFRNFLQGLPCRTPSSSFSGHLAIALDWLLGKRDAERDAGRRRLSV